MESPRKIAVLGAGFWSQFQIPAWLELSDVECAALCDIDGAKAKALADRFGVPKYFDDPEELLRFGAPGSFGRHHKSRDPPRYGCSCGEASRSGDLPEAAGQ